MNYKNSMLNICKSLILHQNYFICGPIKDNEEAMQILICETKDEALKLVKSDPFIIKGYYASYEVH